MSGCATALYDDAMTWDKRATTRRAADWDDRSNPAPDAHVIYLGLVPEAEQAGASEAEPLRIGDRFLLKRGETLTFGRGERCNVIIRSDDLSRAHALLAFIPGMQGKLVLIDLESKSGCWVDGKQAPLFELTPGAEFALARTYRFRYQPAY